MTNKPHTTVSLVLGSVGARGLAHIGIIRWLEEHGYEIKSISGCSIGSLFGGVYDIANQAFDAMQSTIARQKLAAYPADHNIEIARNACGTLEFDLADEMIQLGYQKAELCFKRKD